MEDMMNTFKDPEKFFVEKLDLIGQQHVIIDLSLGENVMEGLR